MINRTLWSVNPPSGWSTREFNATPRMQKPKRAKRHRKLEDNFHAKRPIEKKIIYVNETWGTTTVKVVLYEATAPCTVSSISWQQHFYHESILFELVQAGWAVGIRRSTTAGIGNISFIDQTDFMDSTEKFVMAHGLVATCWSTALPAEGASQAPSLVNVVGKSKASRKMQKGDKLEFAFACDTANGIIFGGVFQFFIKF